MLGAHLALRGAFGAFGAPPAVADRLERELREALGTLDVWHFPFGVVGRIPGGQGGATPASDCAWWTAIGDFPAGRKYRDDAPRADGHLPFRGVLVRVNDAAVELNADWLNSVQLFYGLANESLVFSTHLRPLARATKSAPDPVGLMQFLREGAQPTARTSFQGIRRLLPGQVLRFEVGGSGQVEETSRLWSSGDSWSTSTDALGAQGISRGSSSQIGGGAAGSGDVAWSLLLDALSPLADADRPALMLSAGWDSRTLLAALRAVGIRRVLGYTHGPPQSREVRLTTRLAKTAGIQLDIEPLDAEMFGPAFLASEYPTQECLLFPYWMMAGKRLAKAGADVVLAGVLGEVLGGHYGTTMVRSGPGRFADLARRMAGRSGPPTEARELLLPRLARLPWYARNDRWPSPADLGSGLRTDVVQALDRLRARGVPDGDAMVEAYVTETRGCQYICAQLESIHPAVSVLAPFGDRRLARLATALPMHLRIHNRWNREILARHAPDLMRLPLAATLVAAGRPLAVQETSRLIRWALENLQWRLHRATGGRMPQPSWGWVDFSFLRSGVLSPLIDSLESELWDRAALRKVADRVEGLEGLQNVHPWFNQFAKILTIDHLLR